MRTLTSAGCEPETATAYYDPGSPSESFLLEKRNVLLPAIMILLGGQGVRGRARESITRIRDRTLANEGDRRWPLGT